MVVAHSTKAEVAIWIGCLGFIAIHLVGAYAVGKDPVHLKLTLQSGPLSLPAIWFRARTHAGAPMPLKTGDGARLVYQLTDNVYRGLRSLQLLVKCGYRD